MIRRFCDICGREIEDVSKGRSVTIDRLLNPWPAPRYFELCAKCGEIASSLLGTSWGAK